MSDARAHRKFSCFGGILVDTVFYMHVLVISMSRVTRNTPRRGLAAAGL